MSYHKGGKSGKGGKKWTVKLIGTILAIGISVALYGCSTTANSTNGGSTSSFMGPLEQQSLANLSNAALLELMNYWQKKLTSQTSSIAEKRQAVAAISELQPVFNQRGLRYKVYLPTLEK